MWSQIETSRRNRSTIRRCMRFGSLIYSALSDLMVMVDALLVGREDTPLPGGTVTVTADARTELDRTHELGPEAINNYLEYKSIYAGPNQI